MGETTEELKRDIEDTRASMSGTLEAIGDRVSPGRMLERRRNRIVLWFTNARHRVMGKAEDISGQITDTAHSVGSAPAAGLDAMRANTSGAPLVAGGVAFGVGILVGSLVPPTRTERQLGPRALKAAEPLTEELKDAGQQLIDELKEPVAEAVRDVKETAQAGARQVRETAGDAATERRESPAG